MAATVQQLRTTSATAIPAKLAPGQIAFSLANNWMFVGVDGADILVHGKALASAAYGTTQTILGKANVSVPAKPSAGGGYEIFDLRGGGIDHGGAVPTANASNVGALFVDTSTAGSPKLLISNGTSFTSVARPPKLYSLTDKEVHDAAGAAFTAKANAGLTTKVSGYKTTELQTGDELLVTANAAGPYTDAPLGQYIWDGTTWHLAGGQVPDATARTGTANVGTGGVKGAVYLARDSDVAETGASGSTTPDPLAVVKASQFKTLNDLVGTLTSGVAMLGTYDASASQIAHLNATATAGGRTGLAQNGKLSAGSALKEGDFFLVSKAGTPTGDAAEVNVALNANDHLVWTGVKWHVVNAGYDVGPITLHSCADVADGAVATVTTAHLKGILVRDSSVADGLANAYKLVDTLDLGTF